ncbi:energy transducer TonB [Winogradskyella eximia]|uniref:energy transducer TonB n=1 Tax=Winogradskyella eximia TaxID=262006 RepID=UPI00249265F7|nr:energy transducer TonB [Winogradskyella eximia]
MKYLFTIILLLLSFQLTLAQNTEKADGPFKKYYDSGELHLEGEYQSKKPVGTWKSYHKNGQVLSIYSYKNGKRSKEFISYYEDGSLESKIEKEEDTYIKRSYYNSGKLKTLSEVGNGYYKEYLENGKLLIESSYRDYELFGQWKRYYENGQLEWMVVYKYGYRDGLYKHYYQNGDLKLEGNLSKDKVDGEEKRYLTNRVLEWSGNYNKGLLNGNWTKFDEVGTEIEKVKFKKGVATKSDSPNILIPSKIPEGITETLPIFPGCEDSLTNKTRSVCMNTNMNKFISKNFNTNLSKGLAPGKKRMKVDFKIEKNGKIEVVKVNGPSIKLQLEAYRVMNILPKFKPAIQNGKAVCFPGSIPITFVVQ